MNGEILNLMILWSGKIPKNSEDTLKSKLGAMSAENVSASKTTIWKLSINIWRWRVKFAKIGANRANQMQNIYHCNVIFARFTL